MQEMIELFNAEQEAQGKARIRIGIGIASGTVIAGYTGTLRRATYTCVGDAVNLAARLEAYTKEVGQAILIDEATCAGMGGAVPVTSLGQSEIRGIGVVSVYAVSMPPEASR
jgi:class 3 adenylate cyclase